MVDHSLTATFCFETRFQSIDCWASVLLMGKSFIDLMECDLEDENKLVNVLTFPFLNYKDLFFIQILRVAIIIP